MGQGEMGADRRGHQRGATCAHVPRTYPTPPHPHPTPIHPHPTPPHPQLECFPSCAPTLGCLAAALPPLTARFYSLTSCPATSPDKVSVAFSVVEWDAAGVGRKGLCTSQLEALVAPALAGAGAGSNVAGMPPLSLTLKPATDFTVPTDLTRPVIMIGPGTGVAPFMGFIDARRAQVSCLCNRLSIQSGCLCEQSAPACLYNQSHTRLTM